MKLVLLPGLDGTGKLFTPLIEALPDSIDTQIITYDTDKKQSYDELVKYVKQKLPKENFILLAESFSGPIAYNIALSKPKQLKSLILVATFLENPRPLLLKLIPSFRILSFPIPNLLSRIFFLGFSVETKIIKLFNEVVKAVPPNIIKYRLNEITKLKHDKQKIKLKTTYIQASNDKIVPTESLKDWQLVCNDIDIFIVEGNHLILQENSIKSSEIITKVVDSVARIRN